MTLNKDDGQESARWELRQYENTIAGLRSHLELQCSLSTATRMFLDGKPNSLCQPLGHDVSLLQVRTYQTLLRAIEISSSTLVKLTEKIGGQVRDCLPISRSIVESAINLAYIAAAGPEIAEEARQHSIRRSVRDLERHLKIGHLQFHDRASSLDRKGGGPAQEMALRILAEEKLKKPQNWTRLSVPERISVILNRFGEQIGTPLARAYFSVYSDASEVVHGTVYGCFLSFGETKSDPATSLHDCAFVVLFGSATALNSAIAAIGSAHDVSELVKKANEYDLLLARIPVFAEELLNQKSPR